MWLMKTATMQVQASCLTWSTKPALRLMTTAQRVWLVAMLVT